ncbi:MAG: iron ABC transporter permease [Abditibacteriota bacterium]|nr:iron ABC transporter permease [Abditibacteriota bacterium]MBP5738729.1 iron ABC transporter permease [Abditibacteriota bacterium]
MKTEKSLSSKVFTAVLSLLIPLVLLFLLDMVWGDVRIPLHKVASVISSHLRGGSVTDMTDIIVWEIRFPRALTAVCVGAMLALAGAVFQSLLLNPLADPYTVGVSSGAALGAGLSVAFGFGYMLCGYGSVIMSFAFAVLTMVCVFAMARRGGKVNPERFLLAGIICGSFMWALLAFLLALGANSGDNTEGKLLFWLLGSFEGNTDRGAWGNIPLALPVTIAGTLIVWTLSKRLNVYTLGEENAMTMGVDTERLKKTLILIGSLMTAVAVSVSGIIGFVGLVVPHVCRRLFGADHRIIVPAAALGGAVLALGADVVSRIVVSIGLIPPGVVTALLGAPFFLSIMNRRG